MTDRAEMAAGQHDFVLNPDVVRDAILNLQGTRVHENFVAYLHLRHEAAREDRPTRLSADWSGEVHRWLDVPGGPPNKPHFRPFASRSRDSGAFWMSRNLAGSYAKSSLRDDMRALFVGDDGTYQIPIDNDGNPSIKRVSAALLFGNKVAAWALAAFLYRNHKFINDATTAPSPEDLNRVFFEDFQWRPDEIEVLFDLTLSKRNDPWFLPWHHETVLS